MNVILCSLTLIYHTNVSLTTEDERSELQKTMLCHSVTQHASLY